MSSKAMSRKRKVREVLRCEDVSPCLSPTSDTEVSPFLRQKPRGTRKCGTERADSGSLPVHAARRNRTKGDERGTRGISAKRGKQLAWSKDRRQIRAHVRWKLRLQNDVQTEGRPRPPPGNTVITIITYRALILISPSYVSLSPFRSLSRSRRFVRSPRPRESRRFFLNLSREPINSDLLLP